MTVRGSTKTPSIPGIDRRVSAPSASSASKSAEGGRVKIAD
jgi:hypothetical protein